ncbi:hypothetical protein E4U09_002844 [Claviceps aff. purpurea]|uniref:Uncharacterized protein n=1 Tax=Claviceps aff. purpurea TaxID=1967640 RepID=A0A9P7QHJ7_9HYPO|nr:hypothetical protein E4U09_002844 [Claviceps aff. purpurea]
MAERIRARKKNNSASDPANDVALRWSGLWLRNAATGTQRKWRSSRRFVDLRTYVCHEGILEGSDAPAHDVEQPSTAATTAMASRLRRNQDASADANGLASHL